MANSRFHVLPATQLSLDSEFLPPRTPGTLGSKDAADLEAIARLGDTPGVLGSHDHADSDVVRYRLLPTLRDFEEFEADVLARHVKRAERRNGHKRLPDIPAAELDTVEGKFKLRKEPAARCRSMLKQAREDLRRAKELRKAMPTAEREAEDKKDKAAGFQPVSKVETFGLTSAYRGFEYDSALWHQYFRQKYYWATEEQRARRTFWEGGPHGWMDAEATLEFIVGRKAAPGFSNHTNGIAIDFYTIEDGKVLQAETGLNKKQLEALNARWRKSWIYRWLDARRSEYGVSDIPSEAWHWEFQPLLWDGIQVTTGNIA